MKLEIVRLASDGSNWVSYRDRLNITLRMRRWQEHLMSDSVTRAYLDRGDVNNVRPSMQWGDDDETVKHLIMSSVPTRSSTGSKAVPTQGLGGPA